MSSGLIIAGCCCDGLCDAGYVMVPVGIDLDYAGAGRVYPYEYYCTYRRWIGDVPDINGMVLLCVEDDLSGTIVGSKWYGVTLLDGEYTLGEYWDPECTDFRRSVQYDRIYHQCNPDIVHADMRLTNGDQVVGSGERVYEKGTCSSHPSGVGVDCVNTVTWGGDSGEGWVDPDGHECDSDYRHTYGGYCWIRDCEDT